MHNLISGINFLSHSASLAQNTLLMTSHSLIHLPPAHHSHPPSHIHSFIPGSNSPIPQIFCPVRAPGLQELTASFPGRMSYKATKLGLVFVLYLSIHYMVSLFIRAPFYVLLVFIAICAVFWLFWLSYQYLPSDWLERLVCVSILL